VRGLPLLLKERCTVTNCALAPCSLGAGWAARQVGTHCGQSALGVPSPRGAIWCHPHVVLDGFRLNVPKLAAAAAQLGRGWGEVTLMSGGQSGDCIFLTTSQLLPKATLPEICTDGGSQSVSHACLGPSHSASRSGSQWPMQPVGQRANEGG
jgi:hypothetical protein